MTTSVPTSLNLTAYSLQSNSLGSTSCRQPNSLGSASCRQPNSLIRASRRGFTILELLAVITLISILIASTFTAAQYVIRNSRDTAANANTNSLISAISNYRHEYGHWPIPDDNGLLIKLAAQPENTPLPSQNWRISWVTANGITGRTVAFSNANYLVFDMLRDNAAARVANSGLQVPTDNPRNLHFIDDSSVLANTTTGTFKRILLTLDSQGMVEKGHPLVYLDPTNGFDYYTVTFDFEGDTVNVSR